MKVSPLAPFAPSELALFRSVFRSHPAVTKVRLFGSRAKGTHTTHSDFDFALWGDINPLEGQAIAADLDDLPLPYCYDVHVFKCIKSSALRDHIERVAIPLYPEAATELISSDGISAAAIETYFQDLTDGRINFWDVAGNTSHQDLRAVMVLALRTTGGSYRKVADLLHIASEDYSRFMDFLRRRNCMMDYRPFRKMIPQR